MNPEKLAKLQAQVRIGGKGTPRRKVKKISKPLGGTDDKKLQTALQKLRVQNIIQAAVTSNTWVIYGQGEQKDLTELVPGILNQLGPDSLNSLRRLAEAYQAQGGHAHHGHDHDHDHDHDDDVPELVDTNFEETA
ncbi:Nascent polypeptide-associated complex subunit beta [Rhizophlyctis rosea]|nr:Nascent polypeptide-associated complex subunit beta [Rhizophlyctis rosea]